MTPITSMFPPGLAVSENVVPELKEPDWPLLLAFPIAGGVALVAVIALYWKWAKGDTKRKWSSPLKLDDTWSFQDSWASNVTVLGAVFAGFFGATDVLKGLAGPSTNSVLTLVTIAGVLALGLSGAAPLLLLATRSGAGQSADDGLAKPTVFGVVFAGMLTLTGAGGLLAVTLLSAWRNLRLGGLHHWLLPVLGLATALLLWYTVKTLTDTLNTGIAGRSDTADGTRRRRLHVSAIA
ncbi:hypothetical protein OHU07_20510 [Streptomyces phaeochromogenes]